MTVPQGQPQRTSAVVAEAIVVAAIAKQPPGVAEAIAVAAIAMPPVVDSATPPPEEEPRPRPRERYSSRSTNPRVPRRVERSTRLLFVAGDIVAGIRPEEGRHGGRRWGCSMGPFFD